MAMNGMKIGWIGTGVMGKNMCKHIINKGFDLSIFTRTPAKADELVGLGATFKQPKELAKESDILCMMLGFPKDVQQMTMSIDHGLMQHMKRGSYLVDHTTSTPSLAMQIEKQALSLGINSLDAPVSGGEGGSIKGALVTMVGGQKEHLQFCRPILDCYSQEISHMGQAGAGQHTKAANQIMNAANMLGVCEALIYGQKAGLDLDQMIKLLKKGAASSQALVGSAPKMLQRDFKPGFYVEHFAKDLAIALEESRRMKIALPGTALMEQLYNSLIAQEGGRLSTSALLTALETMNNMTVDTYNK